MGVNEGVNIPPRGQSSPLVENHVVKTWGRCFDHNFLQFSTIFSEKFGAFLKNQCCDQQIALFSFVLSQKRQFFAEFFGENI
jgi:hypothetical protein